MTQLTVDDYNALPPAPADLHSAYGPDPSQFGALYLPAAAGPHPTVVLIHGGCWRAEFGLAPLGQMARALTRRGLAVWNIEYRRTGNGGGWPATFHDVAAAVDHLRTPAVAAHVDPARITAVGHSAGGHLALWSAARHRLPYAYGRFGAHSVKVDAVVSLAGIVDLVDAAERALCGDAVRTLMGGPPTDMPAAYAQASPRALTPLGIPHLHIVGAQDTIVPADHVENYVNFARGHGDAAALELPDDAGHFEVVMPNSPAWPLVEARIIAHAVP